MFAGVGAVGRIGRPGLAGAGAHRATFDQSFLGGTLGSGAVFTRASAGWYYNSSGVLVQAGVNVPRFDYDPVTLQLKGLLLEDTSTNIWLQSGDLNNAATGKAGNVVAAPTSTANQTAAPDGTVTAARIVYPTVSGAGAFSMIYQNLAVAAGSYAFSVFLKGNTGGEQIYLTMFDSVTYHTTPRLTLTTQWQRFTVQSATTTAPWFFNIGTDLRDGTQTSTPAQTIYAWGAQVELNYMSSYIPTTSVAVTRAADVLSYPIASVTGFNTTKGSLAHEYIIEGFTPGYNGPIQFLGADPNADYIDVNEFTTSSATPTTPTVAGDSIIVAGAGAGLCTYNLTPVPANAIHRGAHAWAINVLSRGAYDALAATPTTPTTALPVIVELQISGYMHYQNKVSQWARRTRYWPRQLSQAELISATTLDGPTLTLDFMTPGTLDPRITFTRASSATYTDASGTIQTAAINAPRWDYKAGVLQGLLIEEARTNQSFPSTNWYGNATPSNSTDGFIQNVGPDPAGGNAAMAFIPGSYNTAHQFYTLQGGAPSTTYTFSVFAKAAGMDWLYMELGNSGFGVNMVAANFNLTTGTTADNGRIQAYPNGWYRCSITATTPSTAAYPYVPNIRVSRDSTSVVTGNNVDGVWVFGHQFEVGAFPTSYIPTTSVAVTRATDNAAMPTNVSWFNANFGTLQTEFIYMGQLTGGFGCLVALAGGPVGTLSAGTFIEQYVQQVNNVLVTYSKNNDVLIMGGNGTGTSPPVIPGAVSKSACNYQATTMMSALNGTLAPTASPVSGALPIMTQLGFMPYGVNYQGMTTGYMRRVTYWNRALSDTEMQQVTT